jgi:hypothetical protein
MRKTASTFQSRRILSDNEHPLDAPMMFICDPDDNLIPMWGSGACVHTHGLFIGGELLHTVVRRMRARGRGPL